MTKSNLPSKRTVIIVEDDLLLAMINQKYIEDIGYSPVGTFTTGEDAIDAVRESQPDFLLMDILLEGELDGIDTVRKIREFSPVPVVFITGNSNVQIRERAGSVSRAKFLTKPIDMPLLRGALEDLSATDSD